jgi:hypothetical protein
MWVMTRTYVRCYKFDANGVTRPTVYEFLVFYSCPFVFAGPVLKTSNVPRENKTAL